MKITEILLEYRRDVTAKNLGVKLILAIARDRGYLPSLPTDYESLRGITADRLQKWIDYPGGSDQVTDLINAILAAIESKDPTQNKQYTQWLAKMYSNGGLKFEDINRHNLLGLYIIAKRRQMIKPEHTDVNRFKTYKDFENAIFPYDLTNKLQADDEKKVVNKGKSKEVYKDTDVRIIVPEDEAAACYYGQGTKWCTASTEPGTDNMFDEYNSRGTLYIMLPKSPQYPGEKYQLYFTNYKLDYQFMNEKDIPINLEELLKNRFPNSLKFFEKTVPDIKDMILFTPDEVLEKVIAGINKFTNEYINNYLNGDELDSENKSIWLSDIGFNIHNTRRADYENFMNELDSFRSDAIAELAMNPASLKKATLEFDSGARVELIPLVMANVIYNINDEGYGLVEFLRDRIKVKKHSDTWKVELV
jgi:hypothetical protein